MAGEIRLTLDSDLSLVAHAARTVRSICGRRLAPDQVDEVEIAVVEALNNVIEHGYHGHAGHAVDLHIRLGRDRMTVEILDEADPLDAAAVARLTGEALMPETDDPPEGGMGQSLIRLTMDDVHYDRRDGRNRLTLVKYLPPET